MNFEDVKRFYKKVPKFSNDKDISIRLQKAVAEAMRSSFYDIRGNFPDAKKIFKNYLLASFVDNRIFDKAKKTGKTRECFDLAERIVNELWKNIKNENELRKFFELYVKMHQVAKLDLTSSPH